MKKKIVSVLVICSIPLAGIITALLTHYFWVREQTVVYFDDEVKFDLSQLPYKGTDKAIVEIVSVFDPMCHYCDSLNLVLDSVASVYGSHIKLYEKPVALLNKQSGLLTRALLVASRHDVYHDMIKEVFRIASYAKEIKPKKLQDSIMVSVNKLGLDKNEFKKMMNSKEIKQKIKKQKSEAQKYGIRSIPLVFINGYIMWGFLPFEKYSDVIEKFITEKGVVLKKISESGENIETDG